MALLQECHEKNVSTHAPVRARRAGAFLFALRNFCFNSRAREGATSRHIVEHVTRHVSTHAPVRARRGCEIRQCLRVQGFNSRAREGATRP